MIKTFFVDSFTTEPFKGNPAGVCILSTELTNEKMQSIAAEVGFSETAFVLEDAKEPVYHIRYFSPKKEIPLCGHATLAAAKILFEINAETVLRFFTGENLELITRRDGIHIIMEFPVYQTSSLEIPHKTAMALGIKQVRNAVFSNNNKIILLEIDSARELVSIEPDFEALVKSYQGINGVLVTAPSDTTEYDYQYRYFWPWAGTNEDPVTGGVQTFLAKYWSDRLGKKRMKAFQCSQRTGFMEVELRGDKVLIYGTAVIVFEGNLVL